MDPFSQTTLSRFFEHLPEEIFTVELDPPVPTDLSTEAQVALILERARIRYCNAFFAQNRGRRPAEVIGTLLRDQLQMPHAEPTRLIRAFVQRGHRAEEIHGHWPVRAEGNVERSYRLSALGEVVDGALQSVWIRSREATEVDQAQRGLVESERRYHELFDSAGDAMFVTDGHVVTDCNERNAALHGLERSAIIGAPLLSFSAPTLRDGRSAESVARDVMERVLRGEVCTEPWLLNTARGPRDVEVTVRKLALPEGIRLLGIVRDVTERLEMERELSAHRQQLEHLVAQRTAELSAAQESLLQKEKLAVLGQLLATVSHEVRNPLGTLRTCLFSLKDALQRDQPERLPSALELAERSVRRIDGIIDDLLDFSRHRELDRQVLPVARWVADVLAEQNNLAGIQLEEDYPYAGTASFDPERMRRALTNVVTNAVQAMQETAPQDRVLKVSVGVSKTGECEIRVADRGPGIAPEIRDRIFEPLFSTKPFGVGLGTSIARDSLQRHGGGIRIESEPGTGTCVVLHFPLGAASL